jgi:hypothetical protein
MHSYAYGEGVVIGKHVRLGDRRIVRPATRIFAADVRNLLRDPQRRRRDISMLGHKAWGVLVGLSSAWAVQSGYGRALVLRARRVSYRRWRPRARAEARAAELVPVVRPFLWIPAASDGAARRRAHLPGP